MAACHVSATQQFYLDQVSDNATSLNSFKNRLDKLWIKKSMYYDYEDVYKFEHNIVPTNVMYCYEQLPLENDDVDTR